MTWLRQEVTVPRWEVVLAVSYIVWHLFIDPALGWLS
jgi:hypothetical protein